MAGVVETTDTFLTNQVITSTVMNNIIDQTLFTSDAIVSGNTTLALVAGKLKVGTITSNEMGVGAVTLNAIADGVITNAKISSSTAIDLSKLATGALPAAITIASANIVDGTIATADIASAAITAPKLDGAQTGTAPVFGVRAWVNFNGTTSADIGGTYTRALTTVTVTTSGPHGLIVGHKVFLDFTSGGATDGTFYVATVPDASSFTVTHGTSGTISTSNVTLPRRLINASGNVANVSYLAAGTYAVNFSIALPDANYARSGFANFTTTATAGFVGGNSITAATEQFCDINVANTTNGAEQNVSLVNVIFVG